MCVVHMELRTAMVLCARSYDSLLTVSVRRLHVVFSSTGFNGGGSHVIRHMKPPRYGEASSKPRSLSWVGTQAIGALVHGCSL